MEKVLEQALSPSCCSRSHWGRDANYIVSATAENFCQLSFKPRQAGSTFNMSANFSIPSVEAGNPCWISELPVKASTAPHEGEVVCPCLKCNPECKLHRAMCQNGATLSHTLGLMWLD